MAEIPWRTVTENVGASFDSIRDIFVHSLQAEHFWIVRLQGRSTEGIYGGGSFATDFPDIKSIKKYADIVEAETRGYLANLSNEKLRSLFEYKVRDGSKKQNAIEDILMHIVEEEIHHRGEIMCIYWQHEIEAPYVSYTQYKLQSPP
jgi:uncharacterized damage-inducible protein DinB